MQFMNAAALVAVLLVGCSAQPTSPSKTAGSPGATAAAVAPAAPNIVAASAAEKKKAPLGYRAIKRDGQMFYCRETSQIGTRFTKTECITPDEYAEYERSGAEVRQELQRRSNICSVPSGNCGG